MRRQASTHLVHATLLALMGAGTLHCAGGSIRSSAPPGDTTTQASDSGAAVSDASAATQVDEGQGDAGHASNAGTGGTMAGVAVADITPPWPYYMQYSSNGLVTKHYRTLEAKALVIQDGGGSVALVTIDICDTCTELSERIYARAAALGFQPQQIILNSSHIHSAPAACERDLP